MGNCCGWDSRLDSGNLGLTREPLLGGRSNKVQKLVLKPDDFFLFGQDKHGDQFLSIFDVLTGSLRQAVLPKNSNFFNYSAITWKGPTKMIVCGGIKHNLTGITAACFEFDLQTLTCIALPDMINYRYTFPAIYCDNKIYVVGGRVYGGDETSILKSCEMYDYATGKWEKIADLNIPRCTSTLITYQSQVWVLGGYTGQYQRSRKIERYNPVTNTWDLMNFKLLCGFENGNIIKTKNPNEFIIFGGKLNYGTSKNVWVYNLHKKNVLNMKPLYHDNILSKHFQTENGKVYLLGEHPINNYFYESYDTGSMQTNTGALIFPPNHTFEKFKQYNFSSAILNIDFEDELVTPPKDYANINVIFGTDSEPFMIEVNSSTLEVAKRPIPLNLKLRNFQGCCRIDNNRVFFSGGINISFQKISARSFIYNLPTQEVTLVPNMRRMRYTFPTIYMNNAVYVIGGREYGDDKTAIFCDCEKFNFVKNAWERVPSLNIKRCTANAFNYKGQLYVAGGFLPTSKRSDVIEVLNEKKQRWECMGVILPWGFEASCFISCRDEVLFLTGRGDSGDFADKFVLNLQDGDLDQVTILPEKVTKESCLNKLAIVRDKFVLFGGSDFSNILMVNSDDYANTVVEVKSHRGDNSTTMDSDCAVSELENFGKELKDVVSSVCYSTHFLKRNAFIITSQYTF